MDYLLSKVVLTSYVFLYNNNVQWRSVYSLEDHTVCMKIPHWTPEQTTWENVQALMYVIVHICTYIHMCFYLIISTIVPFYHIFAFFLCVFVCVCVCVCVCGGGVVAVPQIHVYPRV